MFTLSLPGTDAVLQQQVETRPRAVAEWLDTLPYAQPQQTAQQVLMSLHGLNRQTLDDDDRASLLALYRPAVARAAAGLGVLITDSGLPAPMQQRQAAALLRELLIEWGIAYKHVLRAMANRRLLRASAKRIAEVTARALRTNFDTLFSCALARVPPPPGLWREMHQIFAYAQASGAADLAVDDAPTPNTAYCQAVLFARADPSHMSHAELLHTRLYLDKYARRAALAPSPIVGHTGFSVPIHGDVAPSPVVAATASEKLWLDTSVLGKHLEAVALHLRTGDTPSRIRLPEGMQSETTELLCAHLIKQWCAGPQRAFRRHAPIGKVVNAVTGLAAIHRLLNPTPPRPGEDGSLPTTLPVSPAPLPWKLINDSAGGLALAGPLDKTTILRVSEPIAFQETPKGGWSLGVIRWLRMRDAREAEFGIERLAPRVEAVWVRPLRGHRATSAETGLFVPGVAALKQADRLLLPRHLYQLGIEAEITHGGRSYLVVFGKRTDPTPGFDLVDFTIFEDKHA